MPKTLQAKLLRSLESGEVRRIGENETRHVDVRFSRPPISTCRARSIAASSAAICSIA